MSSGISSARVGWTTPRRVIDSEVYDFYHVAPRGVQMVCNNLVVRESSNLDECKAAYALIESRVDALIEARVDIAMVLGEPVLWSEGLSGYRKLLERLRAKTNTPITTSTEALINAFKHMAVKRLLMVSTLPSERQYPMEAFRGVFKEAGVELAGVKHIQHGLLSIGKGSITPSQIYEQIKAGLSEKPDVDTIFLQSGTLRAVDNIKAWEKEIKKTIISITNAVIWESLRPLNIAVGNSYGKLLASLGK